MVCRLTAISRPHRPVKRWKPLFAGAVGSSSPFCFHKSWVRECDLVWLSTWRKHMGRITALKHEGQTVRLAAFNQISPVLVEIVPKRRNVSLTRCGSQGDGCGVWWLDWGLNHRCLLIAVMRSFKFQQHQGSSHSSQPFKTCYFPAKKTSWCMKVRAAG